MMTLVFGAFSAFLGFGLGALQFASLYENVRLYIESDARTRAVLVHAARLCLAALGWLGLARLGAALGLITGLVGFVLARVLITSLAARAA